MVIGFWQPFAGKGHVASLIDQFRDEGGGPFVPRGDVPCRDVILPSFERPPVGVRIGVAGGDAGVLEQFDGRAFDLFRVGHARWRSAALVVDGIAGVRIVILAAGPGKAQEAEAAKGQAAGLTSSCRFPWVCRLLSARRPFDKGWLP